MKKRKACEEWAKKNWKIRIQRRTLARVVITILIIFIVVMILEIMKM